MVGQAGQAAGSACAKGGGRPRRRAAFGRRKRETRGSALRLPGSEGQTRASERARGGDKDEIDGLTFFLDERRLLRGLIPGFVSPLMLERVLRLPPQSLMVLPVLVLVLVPPRCCGQHWRRLRPRPCPRYYWR